MRTPIYKMAVEEAAWEAVLPESDSPIPNIRADFLRFGSKIVEHSRYLPVTVKMVIWLNVRRNPPQGSNFGCVANNLRKMLEA